MEFLFSNLPPCKTKAQTFRNMFYSLANDYKHIDIAVGYVTTDSLYELKRAAELLELKHLNLTIGMHYIEKFTKLQYQAAMGLDEYLRELQIGSVKVVTAFQFHGKLYSYSDDKPRAGIIGSNNLGSIVNRYSRVYEASYLIRQPDEAKQMYSFIEKLNQTAVQEIKAVEISDFKKENPLLEEHENVTRISRSEMSTVHKELTEIAFEIPLKTYEEAPASNLNAYFGKGREGKNGLVKPRHWYEVELIVPKQIATKPDYPISRTEEAEFEVITDDGWRFGCKISGDYNKNFRSRNDLKILGKWLKGRMENAGVLKVGDPVTEDTFRRYGRNTFTLTKTIHSNLWFLDFKV